MAIYFLFCFAFGFSNQIGGQWRKKICTNIACLKNINFIFAVSISAMAEPKNFVRVCVCVHILKLKRNTTHKSAHVYNMFNVRNSQYKSILNSLVSLDFFCSLTFHLYLHFVSTCIHRSEKKEFVCFFLKLSK